ncbi:MAG: hypothetical protein ACFHU9_00305 [Fluviicola sp.]
MKSILIILLIKLLSFQVLCQDESNYSSGYLRDKFNPPNSFLQFDFNYDTLKYESYEKVSGNGTVQIERYSGYAFEKDSFNGGTGVIHVLDTEQVFIIEVIDKVATLIQERYESANGISYVSYNFNPYSNKSQIRLFSDNGNAVLIEDTEDKILVNLNNTVVEWDSSLNLVKSYHLDSVFNIQEYSDGRDILVRNYHDNERIKEQFNIDYLGFRQGDYYLYDEDGRLVENGFYSVFDNKEVKHGVWIYYNVCGLPIKISQYKFGVLVKSKRIRRFKCEE